MRIIDFEHHSYPKEFFDFAAKRTTAPTYDKEKRILKYKDFDCSDSIDSFSLNSPETNVLEELTDYGELRISEMDYAGCTQAMISSGHCFEELSREDSIQVCRIANDRIAETVAKYPDRFYGAFCLPSPYVDAALEEMDRAVNKLGLKMWQTHSNYGKESLWMEKYEPLFAKLNEYGLPFYVHPNSPEADYLLDYGTCIAGAGLGFGVDVMNTTMRIILNGTFDRYPNIKMIIGHMGEYYPFSVDRIDNRNFNDEYSKCKHTFRYYFENKNIFFTTSGVFNTASFICAKDSIGIDNILFGSDYPYEDLKRGVDFIMSLPISDEEKAKVCYGNAEKYILK